VPTALLVPKVHQVHRESLVRPAKPARLVPKALKVNRASLECRTFLDPKGRLVRPALRAIPVLLALRARLALRDLSV